MLILINIETVIMKQIKFFIPIFLAISIISCNVNDTEVNEKPDKDFATSPTVQVQKSQFNCVPPDLPCPPPEQYYLDPPILTSPSNNSFQETTVYFQWQNPSSNPNLTRYRLEIDNNSNFSSPEYSYGGLTSNNKTVYGLDRNEKFYWKVIAYDPDPPSFPSHECCYSSISSTLSIRVRPPSSSLNGTLEYDKPKLSWAFDASQSKLFRESYTQGINNTQYTFTYTPFEPTPVPKTVTESQLSQDFIIPQNAQLFNTISYHVVNYNSQGWPSLTSNYVFYEIDGGGGGIGGL